MQRSYGQYCPLALAAELLCQRWTLLVVSRLLDGCTTFSDIRRGLPRISPTLLSRRLAELQQAGLVERLERERGYRLTEAGLALDGIVMDLAAWGQRWARDMTHDDLDPAFLAWSMEQHIERPALPAGDVVVEFEFPDIRTGLDRFWMVCHERAAKMCLRDPGLETDLLVRADVRCFIEAWRGLRDLRNEIRQRRVRLYGPQHLKDDFPNWLQLSALSVFPRLKPGSEQRTAKSALRSTH